MKWILENIDVTSTLVSQIVQSFSNSDKFKFPLPIAEEILSHPQFKLVGLKLFLLETPMSKKNEKLFLSHFGDLNTEDKTQVVSFARQRNSNKSNQLMHILFKMSFLLNPSQFYAFVNGGYADRDNYILAWKNYSITMGRKLDENELWRYYFLTKKHEIKVELIKILSLKTVCSPERLDVINSLSHASSDFSAFDEALENHIECAEKPKLKVTILNMLRPVQYSAPERKNFYIDMIRKNKKLSTATKNELEEFLKTVDVNTISPLPINDDIDGS